LKSAGPGEPVLILGFQELPSVGDVITGDKGAAKSAKINTSEKQKAGEEELAVLIKANSAGSLDAIKSSVPKGVKVLKSGVGEVGESDVFFAKTSKSTIIVFEAKLPSAVKKLAENEQVQIYEFKIIYELIQKLEELVDLKQTKILGKLEILARFPYNKREVAGCKVLEGKVMTKNTLLLTRNEKELAQVKVSSLRRGKNEINEAKVGEECGILFSPAEKFEIGDILVAIE